MELMHLVSLAPTTVVLILCLSVAFIIYTIIKATKNKGDGYKKAIVGSILFSVGAITTILSATLTRSSSSVNSIYKLLLPFGILFAGVGYYWTYKYHWYVYNNKLTNKSKH
ncbi:MAG: hypothetical protein Q7U71_10015 [bacterium]|nr:hypothetical protein [bacterium]